MKFRTIILCNVTKKKKKKNGRKNFENCTYRDDDVTKDFNFFEK